MITFLVGFFVGLMAPPTIIVAIAICRRLRVLRTIQRNQMVVESVLQQQDVERQQLTDLRLWREKKTRRDALRPRGLVH